MFNNSRMGDFMIKGEKGQAMVEMALLIPVLLLLIVGIIDLGRVLYSYTHLHFATQETVRLGGLGKNDNEITQFARNYINLPDPTLLAVSITPDDTSRNSGNYVTVTLEYPVEFMTPLLSSFIPSPVLLHTNSTIRIE